MMRDGAYNKRRADYLPPPTPMPHPDVISPDTSPNRANDRLRLNYSAPRAPKIPRQPGRIGLE